MAYANLQKKNASAEQATFTLEFCPIKSVKVIFGKIWQFRITEV